MMSVLDVQGNAGVGIVGCDSGGYGGD